MEVSIVINLLRQKSSPVYLDGMQRFGIANQRALGVRVSDLRQIAKTIKKDHELALELWKTGIHEARILASMIDDPNKVTEAQFDSWTADFNSWDVCDQICSNLLHYTPFAVAKAIDYSARSEEFIKRAGFVLMAARAVKDKQADDLIFLQFFPIIEREANDGRNFVKKAVNWALRQIGKRNSNLKKMATASAERIMEQSSKSAKWIATDALRDLSNSAAGKRKAKAH